MKELFEGLGTMLILAIFIIILVFGLYICTFWSANFSLSLEKWGQFGDYVGGILNPAMAFLALVALLSTLRLQRKELYFTRIELEKSSQALQEQAEHFKQDLLLGDIKAAITNIEVIIDSYLDMTVNTDPAQTPISLNEAILNTPASRAQGCYVKEKHILIKQVEDKHHGRSQAAVLLLETMGKLGVYYTQLSRLLYQYEKNSNVGYFVSISKFKYNQLSRQLFHLGFIKSEDVLYMLQWEDLPESVAKDGEPSKYIGVR